MSKVKFITVKQFKEQTKSTDLQVLENPNTGKLFLTNGDQNWKVQQELDIEKQMRILVPEEGMEEACLVNVKSVAKVVIDL